MGVARLLYRSLASTLRDQARSLEFGTSWPRRPGLQGLAAAGLVIDLGERTTAALEWEDFLQRSELRTSPFCFLRPFFAETSELAWCRIQREYPVLAALGVPDAIDRGFAALRQASSHAELLERLQPHDPGPPARKPRPAHLLFACGDVCIHRFFGRCVVVGWDETCPQSEEWVVSNRIRESLKFGTEQPFYHVLLERDETPRCLLVTPHAHDLARVCYLLAVLMLSLARTLRAGAALRKTSPSTARTPACSHTPTHPSTSRCVSAARGVRLSLS